MKCLGCGFENKVGAKFCATCGAALAGQITQNENLKTCPDCGSGCKPDAKFCPKCGHGFSAAASAKSVETGQVLPPVIPAPPQEAKPAIQPVAAKVPVEVGQVRPPVTPAPSQGAKPAMQPAPEKKTENTTKPAASTATSQSATEQSMSADNQGAGGKKSSKSVMLVAGFVVLSAFAAGGYWFMTKPDAEASAPVMTESVPVAPASGQPVQAVAIDTPQPAFAAPVFDSDLENALRCKGLGNVDAIEAAIKKGGAVQVRAPAGSRKYSVFSTMLFGVPAESITFYGGSGSEWIGVIAELKVPESELSGKVAKLTTVKEQDFSIKSVGTNKTEVACIFDPASGEDEEVSEPVKTAPPATSTAQPKQVQSKPVQSASPPVVAKPAPVAPKKKEAEPSVAAKQTLDQLYNQQVAKEGCKSGFFGIPCRESIKADLCRKYNAFGKDSLCPSSDPKNNPNVNPNVPRYGN